MLNIIAYTLGVIVKSKSLPSTRRDKAMNLSELSQLSDNERVNERVNRTMRDVFAFLEKNPYASYREIASGLEKSYSTVQRAIQNLKKGGFLIREGSDKTGYWRILKEL